MVNPLVIMALIKALTQEVTLLEAELAEQQAVVSTTYTPPVVPIQPDISPSLGSESPVVQPTLGDAPVSTTTTAWIEFNNQTGTVVLPPGIYQGQLSWGSTNTTNPGCGILGAGGWAGNFGTSGTKTSGGWIPGVHIITLTCNGNPKITTSVTVIDSDP